MQRIRTYLSESYSELKKVTWPTRDQTRNLSALVFVVSAAVGAYIFVFDTIFTEALAIINRTFT